MSIESNLDRLIQFFDTLKCRLDATRDLARLNGLRSRVALFEEVREVDDTGALGFRHMRETAERADGERRPEG